jgi:hypothetical protein
MIRRTALRAAFGFTAGWVLSGAIMDLSSQSSDLGRVVTAQVLLRPQSGQQIRGEVPITSANIAEYQPSPADLSAVMAAFRAAGFEVGPFVGISFVITAPARVFEAFFSTKLGFDRDGVVQVMECIS